MDKASRRNGLVRVGIAFALMVAGGELLLGPVVQDALFRYQANQRIEAVMQARDVIKGAGGELKQSSGGGAGVPGDITASQLAQARQNLEAYNKQVSAGERAISGDPFGFSDTVGAFETSVMQDGLVGSIDIPAMDCSLPLYLGSSYEHMAEGATVVEGSSAPLGGPSTNCVIAAHRGWNSAAMFRDIERLELGDCVTVHTVWDDLSYTVVDIRIIDPSDAQAVGVQDGADLVTLVTCHPYGYNHQRYAVFCAREGTDLSPDFVKDVDSVEDAGSAYEGLAADAIFENPAFEDALRFGGVAVLVACFCVALKQFRNA